MPDERGGMDPTQGRIQENRDSRPVPDPTVLTTQALHREIAGLRELFEMRLVAMDRAIILLQSYADRSPTVAELAASHGEKFRSIATQIQERDTRTEQTSRDRKVAVDTALQAANEAVGEQNKSSALAIAKSEASTTKQIDQIAVLLMTSNKATDDKFSDLKDRLTSIEGRALGVDRAEKKSGDHLGFMVAAVMALIELGTLAALVFQIAQK